MRFLRQVVLSAPVLAIGICAANATDLSASNADANSAYEIRISGLSHNIEPTGHEHSEYDIGGSLVFPLVAKMNASGNEPWIPRGHVGGTLNTAGNTSFAYAGLTWNIPFAQVYFASVDFGGAFNNANLRTDIPDRVQMGCHTTFRESAAIGRAITDHISVAATVEHFSNANLCQQNAGITNIGLMVGYKF